MALLKQPPSSETNLPTHKLVVIGSGGVGKSSLTIQFFQKQFVDYYDPTIEEQYIQHCEIDGQWCKLDVLDTAGQDEFAAMLDHHMRTGRGFLLVFSVTDRKSYDGVHKLFTKILRLKDRDTYPVLLVGNKVDLIRQRVITTEQGQQLATELNIPYIETSAREYQNVDEAFHQLVRICRRYNYDEDRDALINGQTCAGARSSQRRKRCILM